MFVHEGRPVCAMVHNIIFSAGTQGEAARGVSIDLMIQRDSLDI